MYELLLVTGICDIDGTGRSKLRAVNKSVLSDIYGEKMILHQFLPPAKNRMHELLLGQMDGQSKEALNEVVRKLDGLSRNAKVFVDGSNYGTACQLIERRRPDLKIYVFHHNIEKGFFWNSFISRKTIKSFFIYLYYFQQEKKSNSVSYLSIFLTKADLMLASRNYRITRSKIVPLCTDVKFAFSRESRVGPKNIINCLFLGGAFYGNLEAAFWISNQLAGIKWINVRIVGKGFDKYITELSKDNISVVGYLENIAECYDWADVVLNPIFSGSGMKTKIAEALGFGKKIISTDFGACGYEEVISMITIANNKEEFLSALREELEFLNRSENANLYVQSSEKRYTAYKNYYSLDAMKQKLDQLLLHES